MDENVGVLLSMWYAVFQAGNVVIVSTLMSSDYKHHPIQLIFE